MYVPFNSMPKAGQQRTVSAEEEVLALPLNI